MARYVLTAYSGRPRYIGSKEAKCLECRKHMQEDSGGRGKGGSRGHTTCRLESH